MVRRKNWKGKLTRVERAQMRVFANLYRKMADDEADQAEREALLHAAETAEELGAEPTAEEDSE